MRPKLCLLAFTLFSAYLFSQPSIIEGALGVGIEPGLFKVKILHGSFGVKLENIFTQDDWELQSNGGGLSLYGNGGFLGNFNPQTGVYTALSDARLKKDIKLMTPVLSKINALRPYTYQMNNLKIGDSSESPHYGFMAQEVMTIFPHLVTHHINLDRQLDVYTLDYSGFGVIAIKAIQELEERIDFLEKRLNQLEFSKQTMSEGN